MAEFNGYNFDDPKTRKRMKYVVIQDGDLDINNAYAFTCKSKAKKFVNSDDHWRAPLAVFEVKDVTSELM